MVEEDSKRNGVVDKEQCQDAESSVNVEDNDESENNNLNKGNESKHENKCPETLTNEYQSGETEQNQELLESENEQKQELLENVNMDSAYSEPNRTDISGSIEDL